MKALSPAAVTEIEATMNLLPFVKWDRFISGNYIDSEDGYLTAYGWIDRPDHRSDFVLLEFPMIDADGKLTTTPSFTTSSAERSREIQRLLEGTDEDHVDCVRIEDEFEGVANVARAAA